MSGAHVTVAIRAAIAARARYCCGYCLTAESIVGMPMDVEHIIPEARGGETTEDNLWLACPRCNAHKADRIAATDPDTGKVVRLFNPRQQRWDDHFDWTDGGIRVAGRTPSGRATVVALHLNRPMLVAARQAWVMVGWHPPGADVGPPPAEQDVTQN